MKYSDAQSITQADRIAFKELLDLNDEYTEEYRQEVLDGKHDAHHTCQLLARHRLASQPTSAEDVAAWRYERNGVVVLHSCRKPLYLTTGMGEWTETPLYARPTSDTQIAAIGAEAMREGLQSIVNHADGPVSVMIAKRLLNTLSQPVAAPQAEMAGGGKREDKLQTRETMLLGSTPPQPEGDTVAGKYRKVLEAIKQEGMRNHNTRCREWWPAVVEALQPEKNDETL